MCANRRTHNVNMKWNRLLHLGGLALIAVLSTAGAHAQFEGRLAYEDLIKTLTETKLDLATANKIAIQQVEDRGIGFDITEEQDRGLRDAGGDDDLIVAIREWLCEKYWESAEECPEDDRQCQWENLTKALSFHPDDADVLYERGNVLRFLGRFNESIDDYTKALAIRGENYDLFFNRALAYDSSGSYRESLEDLTKAIAIDPKGAPAYFNRAENHVALGDPQNAIKDYSKYVELEPTDPDGFERRGHAYLDIDETRVGWRGLRPGAKDRPEMCRCHGRPCPYFNDQR
jgi:tetratricopeptide (TPR) repeat protein